MRNRKSLYSNLIVVVLSLVLLFDVAQSVFHYANLSLDGDLVKIIAPCESYSVIFTDPFGFKAITQKIQYAGAGRISCHFMMQQWFTTIPSAINYFIEDPVRSVYYSSALFSGLLHVFFIAICLLFVRLKNRFNFRTVLILALLASVFIQYQSFYHNFGIIDLSITYSFFYIFPLLILITYLYPFYKRAQTGDRKKMSLLSHALLFLIALLLSFSGPLIQPIVFILFIIYGYYYLKNSKKGDKVFLVHLSLLTFLCGYAFYVSQFNIESSTQLDLLSRYTLLLEGLFRILTGKLVWPIVIFGSVLNLILLKKSFPGSCNSTLFKYLSLFCAIYIFLLPLGGFRPYRPFIIRYDTFLPVTVIACFIFLITTAKLLVLVREKEKVFYTAWIVVFFVLMIQPDLSFFKRGDNCQFNSLIEIDQSDEKIIDVEPQCQILTWDQKDFANPEIVDAINTSLKQWNIIEAQQSVNFIIK